MTEKNAIALLMTFSIDTARNTSVCSCSLSLVTQSMAARSQTRLTIRLEPQHWSQLVANLTNQWISLSRTQVAKDLWSAIIPFVRK
jgi:hypothetical protein